MLSSDELRDLLPIPPLLLLADEERPPLLEVAERLEDAPLDELFLDAPPLDDEEPPLLEELLPFEDDDPPRDADEPPPRPEDDLDVPREDELFDELFAGPFCEALRLKLFDALPPLPDELPPDEDFDEAPLPDVLFLLALFLDAAFEKAPLLPDLEVDPFEALLLTLEVDVFEDAPFLDALFLVALLLLAPRLAPSELDDLAAPFEAPRRADDLEEAPFFEAPFFEALLEELPPEDLLAPFFEAAFLVDFAMLMGLSRVN